MQTMPGSEENCRVHVRVSLDISGESRAGRERVEVGRKGKAQKLKVVERLGKDGKWMQGHEEAMRRAG